MGPWARAFILDKIGFRSMHSITPNKEGMIVHVVLHQCSRRVASKKLHF
jgi:hypothetical protein